MSDTPNEEIIENVEEETTGKTIQAPKSGSTLDEAHNHVMRELNGEEPEPRPEEPPAEEEVIPEEEVAPVEEEVVEEEVTPPTPQPEEPPVQEEEASEIELPIVKIRDSEGKQHEVRSIDDLPDDFEPDSYKSFLKASEELSKNSIKYEQEVANATVAKEQAESKARSDAVQSEWDKEIEKLDKAGALPKDSAQKQDVIFGVYKLMGDRSAEGRMISSFEDAHDLYLFEQSKGEKPKQDAKANAEKKAMGAMIAGGGRPAPAQKATGEGGRTIQAPRSGMSLDEAHARALRGL